MQDVYGVQVRHPEKEASQKIRVCLRIVSGMYCSAYSFLKKHSMDNFQIESGKILNGYKLLELWTRGRFLTWFPT